MISNKDLRVEGGNLIINGEKHPLDPAVNALTKRANIVQGKLSALDAKLDAIEALEKTASGNPISLTGVAAAYAMSNIMTIEPIQSGSGDPSPTNVRPISGISTASVQTTNGEETNTANITLGRTVYGGSVNFKTGELTVTHGMVDLGTLEWVYHSATSSYSEFFDTVLPNDSILGDSEIAANIISPIYKTIPSKWIAYPDYDNNVQALAKDSRRFITCDSRYNNAADYTSAMTGIILVYELVTPTTLTLTPAELELLKGNNTVSGNGANISISYIGR